MSGYNRQGNRSAAGKSGSRIKHTNAGFQWKPKQKIDGSLDGSSCSQNDKSSVTVESVVKDVASVLEDVATVVKDVDVATVVKDVASDVENLRLKPISCDDDGDSKKVKQFGDKSSVTRESVVKDVASDKQNLKLKPISFDDDGDSKKTKQFGDKSSSTRESVFKDVASDVQNLKLKPVSCDDDGNSKKTKQFGDKSSVIREFVVKDVASDVKNQLKPIPYDDEDDSKKVKQFGDKFQKDDDNGRLNHHVFDICPKNVNSVIKLKAPLHVRNKERRNQIKQSNKGQDIIVLRSGMVLMKGYISSDDQVSIVKTCRDLGISDGGFYRPGYSGGTKLHLQMMCLGKNWDPESHTYTELRAFDNSTPPRIPEKFHHMVKKAIQDSNEFIQGNVGSSDERKVIPSMSPDICIVNFYTKNGRLGLHQDKDESEMSLKKGLPVVSFSIGDSAEFLYGETRNVDEADKVTLESGDVLIFGGKSRLIYHGVTSIRPDTPTSLMEATDMLPGRLNLTFRMF